MAPQIFPHHESKFKNEYKNTKNIMLFPRSYFQETFWKKKTKQLSFKQAMEITTGQT